MDKLLEQVLAGLFNTKPDNVPEVVASLPEEVINNQDRALFRALVVGQRDMKELGDLAGSFTRIVDWTMDPVSLTSRLSLEENARSLKEDFVKNKARGAIESGKWDELYEVMEIAKEGVGKLTPRESYIKYREELASAMSGNVIGLKTGIPSLDEATYGLIPGHIWVAGAYYGQGKTYLAINLINEVLKQGKRVLFFSLEMTAEEIIQRLVALQCGFSMVDTITPSDDHKNVMREEAEDYFLSLMERGKLLIDDTARDANEVAARIVANNKTDKLDLVALDYIQLLAGDDQYDSIRKAMKHLQGIAKHTKTCLFLLSQISNDSQEAGRKSNTDGFKGAGDIGQVANVALKIFREKDEETGEFLPEFDLRLTKVRHGKPGTIKCRIDFPGGKISEEVDAFKDVDIWAMKRETL